MWLLGRHESPVPYADFVTTTTHKTLRGPRGGLILCKEKYAKAVDKAIFPGIQGGPLEHVIAGKAVCLKEAMSDEFKEYIDRLLKNCKVLSEELLKRGFNLVSGGTDNHLMLIDLRSKKLTGKEAENLLGDVNITVNKNAIPGDKEKPNVTSGIRIGTAACTSKGLKESDMIELAEAMNLALSKNIDEEHFEENREKARELVRKITERVENSVR